MTMAFGSEPIFPKYVPQADMRVTYP